MAKAAHRVARRAAARANPKFDLHLNRRLHRDMLLQLSLHFLCSVHNAHKDKLLASSPSTLYEGALLDIVNDELTAGGFGQTPASIFPSFHWMGSSAMVSPRGQLPGHSVMGW